MYPEIFWPVVWRLFCTLLGGLVIFIILCGLVLLFVNYSEGGGISWPRKRRRKSGWKAR